MPSASRSSNLSPARLAVTRKVLVLIARWNEGSPRTPRSGPAVKDSLATTDLLQQDELTASVAPGAAQTAGTPPEWTLEISPHRGLFQIPFRELWDYRDLLLMFVKRDIVTVYKQTILGPLWFFIQPVLTMLIYVLVFGNIANISTDGLPKPLFYLAGILVWNYFADVLTSTSSTFTANAEIFGKVYFPRLLLPLSLAISGLFKFLIQLGLFLAVFVWFALTTDRLHPNLWLLAGPSAVFLIASLGLGLGILLSSLTTKYRDLRFVIQFGMQLLMYATPIIYPMSLLGGRMRQILWWNPMAHFVEMFKYGFLGEGEVSLAGLAYATTFTVVAVAAGLVMFNRTEQSFMDTI